MLLFCRMVSYISFVQNLLKRLFDGLAKKSSHCRRHPPLNGMGSLRKVDINAEEI